MGTLARSRNQGTLPSSQTPSGSANAAIRTPRIERGAQPPPCSMRRLKLEDQKPTDSPELFQLDSWFCLRVDFRRLNCSAFRILVEAVFCSAVGFSDWYTIPWPGLVCSVRHCTHGRNRVAFTREAICICIASEFQFLIF